MATVGKVLILGDEFQASNREGLGISFRVARLVEILKVVDECCRDLSVVDIGESSLRASGEAEELRRWSDGARALGDAGGWLVVTLVPFAVWIDGEGMGRRGVMPVSYTHLRAHET